MVQLVTIPAHDAKVGDVVEVVGHSVGDAPRVGEVLQVTDSPSGLRLNVRWEDGHTSVLFPGTDVVLRRTPVAKKKARR